MVMKRLIWISLLMLMSTTAFAQEQSRNIAQYLQDISVTIKANGATGSGVIITREIRQNSDADEKQKVNFVWTAGHVVDSLRSTRKIIDPNGQERNLVEFRDAKVVKELTEEGRKVGQIEWDAAVILYSDAENGEDLALLMIRKRGFVDVSAEFLLDDSIPPLGTHLFHVGSLLGQAGANSMTQGIIAQVGRVLDLGNRGGKVFDQTTVTAFPGSSGGGVFLAEKNEDQSKYIGMLVRGAGEGFNLIVPVRRMKDWAQKRNIMWAIDPDSSTPTVEEILKIKPEDPGINLEKETQKLPQIITEFPFLIKLENWFEFNPADLTNTV